MPTGFESATALQYKDARGYLPRKQGWTGSGAAPVNAKSGGALPATTSTTLGGALDKGGPPKAFGIDQGDQDVHGYLGHFANDGVLTQGHNVGHKKLGKHAAVVGMAKKGFRKLPGSASGVQGNARFGSPDGTALGLRAPKHERVAMAKLSRRLKRSMGPALSYDTMPVTSSDKKLSVKHKLDSIQHNESHARDHTAKAERAKRELKSLRKIKAKRG